MIHISRIWISLARIARHICTRTFAYPSLMHSKNCWLLRPTRPNLRVSSRNIVCLRDTRHASLAAWVARAMKVFNSRLTRPTRSTLICHEIRLKIRPRGGGRAFGISNQMGVNFIHCRDKSYRFFFHRFQSRVVPLLRKVTWPPKNAAQLMLSA